MPIKGLTRTGEQATLVVLLLLGAVLSLGGGVVMLIEAIHLIGVYVAVIGTFLFVVALGWARDVHLLPFLHRPERTQGATRSALDWQVLRISSLLLNLITILAVILLLLDLLSLGGASDATRADVLSSMTSVTFVVMSVVLGFSVFQSLRTEYGIPKSAYRTVFSILFLAGGAILSLSTIGFANGLNAPVLLLASVTFSSLAAFAWRDLPNIYGLVNEERSIYRSTGRITRTQSAIMPTIVAFGLLFVVLLLFLLFGATTVGRLEDVILQPSFLILGFLMLTAILGSVAAVMLLGRNQDEGDSGPALYEEPKDETITTRRTILWVSLGLAGLTLVFAMVIALGLDIFGVSQGRWVDFVAIAILLGVGPYGFYVSHEYNRIRRLEERFPDFLRDIASSHRGGLTLPSSVAIAARGEYGPLTPEVQRMADQMSWNVPFDEALQNFAERVSTPLIQRTVSLVQEASRSGGATSEVLLAAARDARQLKNMENDRRLSMTLYGVIIYITFFVFLLVAAVLHQQFVPQIIRSSETLVAVGSPGGFTISVVTIEEYRAFYFLASVVQALGGGIVAGMMATGKALLGLRHAFIMVFIAYITFALFLI